MTPEEKIAQATKLLEEAKAELQNKEVVYVPDCIEIVKAYGDYSMLIKNGKQELYYNNYTKLFGVNTRSTMQSIKCKLVKVNREDREVGKIYFETDIDGRCDINNLLSYHLYLGNGKYIWRGHETQVYIPKICSSAWKYTYEVVAV